MTSSRKGMWYVLCAATLWGSAGVCSQYIMQNSQFTPGWLSMYRLLFSGLLLLTLSFMHGDKVFTIITARRDLLALLLFSLFGAVGIQLTFLITIEKSNAATATVLQFLSPTIIVAWLALVRRKRSGKLVLATIFTSLAGTFLLVTHGSPTSLSISPGALFWGILSAFAAAFYTTYPSRLIARYGTLPVVGWSMLIGGLMVAPFSAHPGMDFTASGGVLFAFLYLVVFGGAVAFSLYLKGAQLIGGPKASILSCSEPLSSALLSMLLLGVTFALPDWLGTLLIISSVILISFDSRRKRKRKMTTSRRNDADRR